MATERPRWRVNARSFIGHTLVDEGAEVFYAPPDVQDPSDPRKKVKGHVSANLSPLNDVAQAIIEAQTKDHPDKLQNAEKKAKEQAEAEAEAARVEAELTDGLVKRAQGDTRSVKPGAKGGKGKAAEDEDVA